MDGDQISVTEGARALSDNREREREDRPAEQPAPAPREAGKSYGSDEGGIRAAARNLQAARRSSADDTTEALRNGAFIDEVKINAAKVDELKRDRSDRGVPAMRDPAKPDTVRADRGIDLDLTAEALSAYRATRVMPQDTPSQPASDDDTAAALAESDAQAAARAAERAADPEIQRREAELDAERAAVAETRQAAERLQAQHAGSVEKWSVGVMKFMAENFPEVKNAADAENLRRTNPQRHASLMTAVSQIKGDLEYVQEIGRQFSQSQQQVKAAETRQQRAAFDSYARAEDAKFFEAVPQLKDPAAQMEASRNTIAALKELGISEADVAAAWNTPQFRSAGVQRALHQLGVIHAAKARVAAGRQQKPVPQVQKPGVARPRGAADAEHVQALTSKFERSGSARDAARLLIAKRAARG